MTKSIQEILSPLLIINYVCGLRVIQFSTNDPKQWFSLLYMCLLWLFYNFIMIYGLSYTANYSIEYHVCVGLLIFTTLLSIIIGVYYDKIFRICIKKLITVDDTLDQLGTITDYHMFKIRIVWLALGCIMAIILITCLEISFLKEINFKFLRTIFIPVTRNYCIFISIVADLTIVIILWYIGLKFDQINEHIGKLVRSNKQEKTLTYKYPLLCSYQTRFSKMTRIKCIMWIVMHLHSELCKISRKIDTIFGTQITFEMGCHFAFLTMCFRELSNIIFLKNYMNGHIIFVILIISWLFLHTFKLIFINYICEKVSKKANATKDFINQLSFLSRDLEFRENIVLQITQSPLRFCGLGLFQFGFKFLFGFATSMLTVLIIYLQAHINI